MRFLILLLFSSFLTFAKGLLLATTYPIYYPLKFIAYPERNVDVLINTRTDPHHYELRPTEVKKMLSADYVFTLGLEPWERSLKGRVVKVGNVRGLISYGRQQDPHLWLSPKTYIYLVENLCRQLKETDPSRQVVYEKRCKTYLQKLEELDKLFQNTLSRCRVRYLVSTHTAFAYLARDYQLINVGLRGVHAEEEPKPSELFKIIRLMKEKGVRAIYVEEGYDTTTARYIAEQVGAKVYFLNSSLYPSSPQDDYFSIMKRNLQQLKEGLECQ
ncbi:periplasmic solute binding protein [Thermocrinis albus DSM 14484]|uniref:Periplasmic solute binding protein n=1 Tax=Thermocrinis albus (strain DSM 14484 / JCM 11386 / HI 11/12) TaxID=638303 RepID=D3SP45_THEAH|nr:metal ABC transporter substrate-binding protein [Thermocrinis albus]ADC88932.1 periplasmic solute binding protein [Thermocrinis albus DSM 14484]